MAAMKLLAIFCSLAVALGSSSTSATTTLAKRQSDEGIYCYDLSEFDFQGFSALCPPTSWPIKNDKGLNVLGVLYFALVATTLPDDTIYEAEENIICTVNEPTGNITTEISAEAGKGLVSAGGSVSFELTAVNTGDNSICMFTEGENDRSAAPNITLAQARDRLYEMLTAPNQNCETCGQIRIQPDDATTNSSDPGAILKVDVRSANNCLGNCVGPNSFVETTATPTPSASESAGFKVRAAGDWSIQAVIVSAVVSWGLGVAVFGIVAL